MYDNYMKLTPQQKEFLRAVGRAPIILGDPSSPQGHVTHSQTATDSQVARPQDTKAETPRPNDGMTPSNNPTQKN